MAPPGSPATGWPRTVRACGRAVHGPALSARTFRGRPLCPLASPPNGECHSGSMVNSALVVRGNEITARGLAHRICSVLPLARAANRTAHRQIRASAPRAADACAGVQIARFGATPGGRLDDQNGGYTGDCGVRFWVAARWTVMTVAIRLCYPAARECGSSPDGRGRRPPQLRAGGRPGDRFRRGHGGWPTRGRRRRRRAGAGHARLGALP